MIVELRGGQFVNQGAHLMLRAAVERLKVSRPAARIAMSPSPWAPAAEREALGALLKFPLRKRALDLNGCSEWWPVPVDRWLERHGIVTEAHVEAVLDLSGYAYGDRWGARPLRAATAELRRFGRRGRPYVFLPQAFGPFVSTTGAAQVFGSALCHAALVCPRDAESESALRRVVGVAHAPIERFPDFTIGFPGAPEAAAAHAVDRTSALLIPNVRMLDSLEQRWGEGYLELLASLASALRAEGFVPSVLNHSGREDAPICERLTAYCRRLGLEVGIINELDPVRTKGVIGAAGLVISSRFHGCVSALSQGVPCLATSWNHKYSALFDDFGCPDAVLQHPDRQEGEAKLKTLLRNAPRVQDRLRERGAAMHMQVDAMWSRVFSLMPQS